MPEPRSSTENLIGALAAIARDLCTEEGLVETCALEASQRLRELRGLLLECWPHVVTHSTPSPNLLERLVRELPEVRQ